MQTMLTIDTSNHGSIIKIYKDCQFVLRCPSGPGALYIFYRRVKAIATKSQNHIVIINGEI